MMEDVELYSRTALPPQSRQCGSGIGEAQWQQTRLSSLTFWHYVGGTHISQPFSPAPLERRPLQTNAPISVYIHESCKVD